MTDEQWQRPTRLGDWDVRSLYAHGGSWPWMLSILIDRVQDAEPRTVRPPRSCRTPHVPVEGLTHAAAVIVQMAPPVDFIEAATGRSTADLFPVLS